MAKLMGTMCCNAREAKGDEKRQRGLGTVGSRAKRVEAEDGNASDGTDVLGALFRGRERLADDNVEE